MSYELPDRRTLVHKAIDIDKLSQKNAPVLDEDTGLPAVQQYSWQRKYDGCSVIAVVDDDCEVSFWSRDGKPCLSLGHLEPWLSRLPPGTVLLGEAWRPGAEFREISGEFRRKRTQEGLHLVVFDRLTLREFEAGVSTTPYRQRREGALQAVQRAGGRTNRVILAADCYPWEVAELAARQDEAYDGAVARSWAGHWIAGAGTGGEILKVKNVVDVDLAVIAVEEGKDGFAGTLGAIVCRYEGGQELRVGTGFSHLQRQAWFMDPLDIVGRIVRVTAMKPSGKGSLREPRFKGVRFDKDTPDY